jgi:thioredoxin 1
MPSLTLSDENRAPLLQNLPAQNWFVACLCAAWCGTCSEYYPRFQQLASQYPDLYFIWIDIEDQAAVVGDLDIENFPTLLIQYGDTPTFFGTVLPDLSLAQRLLQAQMAQAKPSAAAGAPNLRQLLAQA